MISVAKHILATVAVALFCYVAFVAVVVLLAAFIDWLKNIKMW